MANCSIARAAPAAADFAPSAPATRGGTRARIVFDHLGARSVPVSHEVHGPAYAPATVVLGGISAGRHLAPTAAEPSIGWWRGLVGDGKALDPARRLLVGIDYLGGKSEAGLLRPVTTHDQARAVAAVLDDLGVAAASLVGASYGGMVALAFAELFPERVSGLVVLCAAHRTHPMATALRSLQRSAASLGSEPGQGLSLARALAMTTYRSAREFEERFSPYALSAGEPGRATARFPVEEYLEARGAAFAGSFGTERFLSLSESIDLHRTDPGSLPAHALLVSVDSDMLVPPWLVRLLAARKGRCPARHVTLASRFGHDAFLKEVEQVSAQVRAGLGDTEEAR